MFNILDHVSGQGNVKGHHEAFSHFGLLGRLDELQRVHTHQKCCVNSHEGYCMGTKGIKKVQFKVRSQKVTIKSKSQTCRATHVFWVILHGDIDVSHLTL